MHGKREALLASVKKAVTEHGLENLSTRLVGKTAGVNDALIYHYFEDKDNLVLEAYKQENGELMSRFLSYVDEVHGIPFCFRDKARLCFHRMWRELLSDPERLVFCVAYYHSAIFKNAQDFHEKQLQSVMCKVTKYFPNEEVAKQMAYSLLTLLYDTTKRVADGFEQDTPQVEEHTFGMFYALLISQIKDVPNE